jgi:serine/threonine protein kinase
LLIDKDWNIKLCDFGLSRFVTGNEKDIGTLVRFRGTYCYMATEIYFKDQYSIRSDIYSLGVVLWEMLHKCMTGKYEKPYSEYKFIRYDIQIPVQVSFVIQYVPSTPLRSSPFTQRAICSR